MVKIDKFSTFMVHDYIIIQTVVKLQSCRVPRRKVGGSKGEKRYHR